LEELNHNRLTAAVQKIQARLAGLGSHYLMLLRRSSNAVQSVPIDDESLKALLYIAWQMGKVFQEGHRIPSGKKKAPRARQFCPEIAEGLHPETGRCFKGSRLCQLDTMSRVGAGRVYQFHYPAGI